MPSRQPQTTPTDRTSSGASPTIRAIMSTKVVTIDMDETLAQARDLFNAFHFHHLLVIQGQELFGIISDRDLLKAVSPYAGTISETDRDRATLKRRAHQIMSRKLVTVTPETTIEAAAHLLLDHRVSCVPVVTAEGKLIGIATWRDVLREYLKPPAA